jgi:hypothetical protein
MSQRPAARTRALRVIAQDPSVKLGGRILTTRVEVPAEDLQPGPWGCRVQVIDYDASTGTLLRPLEYKAGRDGMLVDPYESASDATLMSDPRFHAQNVYAIVMRTLARFEFALGRRVAWSFSGHQIKVAPHAFADANAFYSNRDEGLFFGYFPGREGIVFSCLSHDVVAHETAHAILDGLRERYTDPSSPDQAGFHEGFADVVALLSVFALPDVVKAVIDRRAEGAERAPHATLIAARDIEPDRLRESTLAGLAEQMGQEMADVRGAALRQSAKLTASPRYKDEEEFLEPHRRGEILVAAMMNAFITVWSARLKAIGPIERGYYDRARVVEEGAAAADYLLTMAIRALDYSMPVHMEFRDYISALVTADREIRPDDSKYQFRKYLRESFKAYGFEPSSKEGGAEPGIWLNPEEQQEWKKRQKREGGARWVTQQFTHDHSHFESLTRDPEEVFRFIWQNRQALELVDNVYTRVISVRPCLRIGPDGFFLRETVAEYIQILDLEAREVAKARIEIPSGMPGDTPVTLYGGATLVFDEFGRVKFSINNPLLHKSRQAARLKYLWEYGYFNRGAARLRRFSHLHRLRAVNGLGYVKEEWH